MGILNSKNMSNLKTGEYDVAIVGSGPGGSATAMSLAHYKSDLKIALIDKSVFPREKVCGDAVPSWIFKDLEDVSAGIHEKFLRSVNPQVFRRTSVYNSKGRHLTLEWNGPGYMVPRLVLDKFLFDQVSENKRVDKIQGVHIKYIQRLDGVFELYDSSRSLIMTARFLIGADGAPSTVVRNLNPSIRMEASQGSAVRCYYENLNIESFETSRIYISKKFSPGYFWFFPMGPHKANVGFGMINSYRIKKGINFREAFDHFIQDNSGVKELLDGGHMTGELKGGFLPFSKGVGTVIGPGFALIGDAANLNDPVSGDGIRNAVISGVLVGKALSKMSDVKTLNEALLTSYQMSLRSRLHSNLKYRSKIVRIGSLFPGLVEKGIQIGDSSLLKTWIKRWI